ncbi:hypothetical protein [Rhizobium sp. Rhizsp82]|uniref:hypothetical protein n=1 Tax=Rhizobium sp. Rhizsp82 TaxID=3243057 RepID=UPI0039B476FD
MTEHFNPSYLLGQIQNAIDNMLVLGQRMNSQIDTIRSVEAEMISQHRSIVSVRDMITLKFGQVQQSLTGLDLRADALFERLNEIEVRVERAFDRIGAAETEAVAVQNLILSAAQANLQTSLTLGEVTKRVVAVEQKIQA